MSAGSTILTVLGVLIFLGGLAWVAYDYLNHHPHAALDYLHIGILVLGVILIVIGAVLSRQRPAAPAASSAAVPPSGT
jgi:hypothetical protein